MATLEENLLEAAKGLSVAWRFIFRGNTQKHTAEEMFGLKHIHVILCCISIMVT